MAALYRLFFLLVCVHVAIFFLVKRSNLSINCFACGPALFHWRDFTTAHMDLVTDDLDQNDSGMESLTASKGDTPERRPMESSSPSTTELEVFGFPSVGGSPTELTSGPLKEYNDEPDESLSERLWGLTEMFPDCVRNGAYTASTKTWCGMKSLYGVSRSVMWVVASSSVILFAPVIFEVERAQMAEMEKSQQKQVLLGTNTALSGPMPSMPPMPR